MAIALDGRRHADTCEIDGAVQHHIPLRECLDPGSEEGSSEASTVVSPPASIFAAALMIKLCSLHSPRPQINVAGVMDV